MKVNSNEYIAEEISKTNAYKHKLIQILNTERLCVKENNGSIFQKFVLANLDTIVTQTTPRIIMFEGPLPAELDIDVCFERGGYYIDTQLPIFQKYKTKIMAILAKYDSAVHNLSSISIRESTPFPEEYKAALLELKEKIIAKYKKYKESKSDKKSKSDKDKDEIDIDKRDKDKMNEEFNREARKIIKVFKDGVDAFNCDIFFDARVYLDALGKDKTVDELKLLKARYDAALKDAKYAKGEFDMIAKIITSLNKFIIAAYESLFKVIARIIEMWKQAQYAVLKPNSSGIGLPSIKGIGARIRSNLSKLTNPLDDLFGLKPSNIKEAREKDNAFVVSVDADEMKADPFKPVGIPRISSTRYTLKDFSPKRNPQDCSHVIDQMDMFKDKYGINPEDIINIKK